MDGVSRQGSCFVLWTVRCLGGLAMTRYTALAMQIAALHLELVNSYSLASLSAGRAQLNRGSPVFKRDMHEPLMSAAFSHTSPPSRTGTSFLPDEAVERAQSGNPIEKVKLAKDGTSAFTDIYEVRRLRWALGVWVNSC